MKLNNIYRLSALALVAIFASCSNEDIETGSTGMITKTFFATQGESVGTRTSIDANDKVMWSSGDAISVFDAANTNNKLTLTTGTYQGTFTGKVNVDGNQWYAIYPYNAGATISGNVVSGVTLPAQQVAKAGQFDKNAYLLTSSTTNENLAFKQVTCLVEVTTLAPASKIVFKSNGAEKLAGTLSLTIGANGVATYNVTDNGSTEVTLVPANGQTSFAAGTYHLCILPQTLAQGFTVEVYDIDTETTLVKTNNTTFDKFKRAKIIELGNTNDWDTVVSEEGNMVDLGLPSGTKWASVNVGAKHPWEFGDYFQWSATEPYYEVQPTESGDVQMKPGKSYDIWHTPYLADDYSSSNTIFPYTKYNRDTDGKTTLDHCNGNHDPNGVCDDAACANWSNGWRTPTYSEYDELLKNTYRMFITWHGIDGCAFFKVKDEAHKNTQDQSYASLYNIVSDVCIFLPMSGYITDKKLGNINYHVFNWLSNTLGCLDFGQRDAYCMSITGSFYKYAAWSQEERHRGQPVRAVHD